MPLDIQRDRVQQLQAEGAAIVEVLPKEEYQHEHLPGAISLPLEELRPDNVERLIGTDTQRPIVAYCQGSD